MSERNANNHGLDYWKSRLQNSLLRLHDEIHKSAEEDRNHAILFETWQEQWMEKREQISQRLAMIEEQLERHFRSMQPRPEFSLVGFQDENR